MAYQKKVSEPNIHISRKEEGAPFSFRVSFRGRTMSGSTFCKTAEVAYEVAKAVSERLRHATLTRDEDVQRIRFEIRRRLGKDHAVQVVEERVPKQQVLDMDDDTNREPTTSYRGACIVLPQDLRPYKSSLAFLKAKRRVIDAYGSAAVGRRTCPICKHPYQHRVGENWHQYAVRKTCGRPSCGGLLAAATRKARGWQLTNSKATAPVETSPTPDVVPIDKEAPLGFHLEQANRRNVVLAEQVGRLKEDIKVILSSDATPQPRRKRGMMGFIKDLFTGSGR